MKKIYIIKKEFKIIIIFNKINNRQEYKYSFIKQIKLRKVLIKVKKKNNKNKKKKIILLMKRKIIS
jgi:hypothetical protein